MCSTHVVAKSCIGNVTHSCLTPKSLSAETRNSCPMCRKPNVDDGSKEDIERLQKWSQRNRSWAQYALGNMYLRGLGVEEDHKRACELYKLASDQGHHIAQYNLGNMYHNGQGVIQSDQLSFKYMKLSADQGVDNAQFNIGKCYTDGTGVEQSGTEACKYYELAADQGNCHAQCKLGIMYEDGDGVIQSDTLAFKFYKLAAEAGDLGAQTRVGYFYASGRSGTQSYTEARGWWTKAAMQGHEDAINNLKLLDDLEVRTTTSSSIAQCNLGTSYARGIGVEQSFTKARECWTKAAEQGQEEAIKNLKQLNEMEGIKTTSSSSNFTDNSTVLCSKCNKPAQTNRILRNCKCKGAQYCNNTCYKAHWKEHKPEHNKLVKLLPSTGETKEEPTEDKKKTTDENKSKTKKQKPNDRCACGSKKKYKKCCGSKKR
jgi:TPR repeat protein